MKKVGELRVLIYKFNKAQSVNWGLHKKNYFRTIIIILIITKRQLLGSLYAPTDTRRVCVVYMGSIKWESWWWEEGVGGACHCM